MKNVFGFAAAILVSLFLCTISYADVATIRATFSYNDNGNEDAEMQGVRLYVDGIQFCEANITDIIAGETSSVLECSNEISYGTRNYTMTALRADGNESPHSMPFQYTINSPPPGTPDQPPTPVLIELHILVNGVEYTITN